MSWDRIERALVVAVVALFLAATTFALLGIWNRDWRWGATAGVTLVLILAIAMAGVIGERSDR